MGFKCCNWPAEWPDGEPAICQRVPLRLFTEAQGLSDTILNDRVCCYDSIVCHSTQGTSDSLAQGLALQPSTHKRRWPLFITLGQTSRSSSPRRDRCGVRLSLRYQGGLSRLCNTDGNESAAVLLLLVYTLSKPRCVFILRPCVIHALTLHVEQNMRKKIFEDRPAVPYQEKVEIL